MSKKVLLILCIFVVALIAIATVYVIYCDNSRKGGNGALSVFEVNSSELTISNEENTITLLGEDRNNLIAKLKSVVNDGTDSKKAEEYNLTIDFNNGYKAYISTENNSVLFEDEIKSINNDDINYIMQYLRN